jgi:hypothetical protein
MAIFDRLVIIKSVGSPAKGRRFETSAAKQGPNRAVKIA